MIETLRELQQQRGGVFAGRPVPLSFANDDQALAAVRQGCALFDRSHWGLVQIGGADRLRFLHNQTTNTFNQRQPGQGCDTVFLTATARTLDLVTVYVTETTLLGLTSPEQDQPLMAWMDRYIFPADRVSLTNLTSSLLAFTLVGPGSEAVLLNLGVQALDPSRFGDHHLVTIGGEAGRLAVGTGLGLEGYTLLIPAAIAALVWAQLQQAGAIPAGEQVWEQLRIEQGRPSPGAELGENYNPLEAGLWQTICFDKGCYIGQETIARLNTYRGVRQQLWGLELSQPVPTGTAITLAGETLGVLTSLVATPQGYRGLGYVRTKAGGAGLVVSLGTASARVVDCPFLARGYLESKAAPTTPPDRRPGSPVPID
ncbi:MAG: folate-binding protein [Cyanobacteria bacterium REEB459]|nr:folate-binding protein [Cyanobacteria bacterium REEB459]